MATYLRSTLFADRHLFPEKPIMRNLGATGNVGIVWNVGIARNLVKRRPIFPSAPYSRIRATTVLLLFEQIISSRYQGVIAYRFLLAILFLLTIYGKSLFVGTSAVCRIIVSSECGIPAKET